VQRRRRTVVEQLLQQQKVDIKLYDAVLTSEADPITPHDQEYEKFLPMLQDYLKSYN